MTTTNDGKTTSEGLAAPNGDGHWRLKRRNGGEVAVTVVGGRIVLPAYDDRADATYSVADLAEAGDEWVRLSPGLDAPEGERGEGGGEEEQADRETFASYQRLVHQWLDDAGSPPKHNDAATRIRAIATDRDRYKAEAARLKDACIRQEHEIVQTLGKALDYPTEGPEVGGDHTSFCTAPWVAEDLARQAAERIANLRERAEKSERERDEHDKRANDLHVELAKSIGAADALRHDRDSWKQSADRWIGLAAEFQEERDEARLAAAKPRLPEPAEGHDREVNRRNAVMSVGGTVLSKEGQRRLALDYLALLSWADSLSSPAAHLRRTDGWGDGEQDHESVTVVTTAADAFGWFARMCVTQPAGVPEMLDIFARVAGAITTPTEESRP